MKGKYKRKMATVKYQSEITLITFTATPARYEGSMMGYEGTRRVEDL